VVERSEHHRNYYRASSLLELERCEESLAATEAEAANNLDRVRTVAAHRVAAEAGLNRSDGFRNRLSEFLLLPLSEVDYLTRDGMAKLFALLWRHVEEMSEDDSLRQGFIDRVLAAGLAPD